MASCYAALAPLLELLHHILYRNRFPRFLLGREQILSSLHQKFSSLLGSLENGALDSPKVTTDQAVHRVEARIIDAAYRLLDIVESEISKQQIRPAESASGGIHLIANIFHQLISACQMPMRELLRSKECDEDLHQVLLVVDSIVEVTREIQESIGSEYLQQQQQQLNDFSTGVDAFQPASNVTSNLVVGLDEDIMMIKDALAGHSSALQVVSVVGIAGIGKTTLAKCIFDDALIMYHFDCRIWVTISQVYNEREVLRNILTSLGKTPDESIGMERLSMYIYERLKGRRYLMVIDDLWSIKFWDDVKRYLPDDCNGSRILVTTRLSDVANNLSISTHPHYIQFLNECQSWDLLQRKVFGSELCPPELEHIGKSIAVKCRGLPLAIVVIARFLYTGDMSKNFWGMVDKDMDSSLSIDDKLSNVLSLSYNNLPPRLKPCFLYMGCFPKDYDINISKLINLWIAEGFFMSDGGSTNLEEMAEECFRDLVERNLVIVTKKGANGVMKHCTLHNILRSFCIQKAFVEGFFAVEQENVDLLPRVENVHRLSLLETSPCRPGKHVRTILWFGKMFSSNFHSVEWDNLNLLRVLGVEVTSTWPIPDAIFQMFGLKYLELYVNVLPPQVRLPPSISTLENLQTFIISSPTFFSLTLPPQIWNMTQLRHLIIGSMILSPVPVDTDMATKKLEYLQTLTTVENFIFTNEAIQMIPNLRKLKISCRGTESSDMWEFYCLYNLLHLSQLEELKIVVDPTVIWSRFVLPINFRGFALPVALRQLTLKGCELSWEQMTSVGCLPNLEVLKLMEDSVVGRKWTPTEGEFLRLKFLLMEKLDLKYWYAEYDHFPCLEHLKINECCELDNIPNEIGEIETLQTIDIYACSEGVAKSAKIILEEQREMGNDWPQVRVHK